jgi:hypothetical protein
MHMAACIRRIASAEGLGFSLANPAIAEMPAVLPVSDCSGKGVCGDRSWCRGNEA